MGDYIASIGVTGAGPRSHFTWINNDGAVLR